MSDNDSFINEVSEEVRRDRMYSLWRRYGPFVIGGLVAVVIAAGVKTWWDGESVEAAKRAGAAVIAASDAPPDEAAAALTTLAEQTSHEGAAVLARLSAAAAHAETGEAEAAAAAYDLIAADGSTPEIIKDFAAFRAVLLRSASMAPEAQIEALTPIVDAGGPFRLLALEAQALAQLRAGDADAAEAALREIEAEERAPQGLIQRVRAVLTSMGLQPSAAG